MKRDSVPPEHDERGTSIAERKKEVAKVFGEIDHVVRLGTNLHGMLSRV